MQQYDVVIVGGRVAGSTLASLLGAGGLEVLLLDRAEFPADTLSTHVIYGDSFGIWERIGAWGAIERLASQKLWGISWIRDGKPDIRGRFWPVRGHDYSLCLRRLLLDDVLFKNAANTPGVTAIEAARVTDILLDGDTVNGVKFETSGSTTESTVAARLVVGCDGRRSTIARAVGANQYVTEPPINFAFYTYIQDADTGPEPEPMFEIWDSEYNGGTPMLAECDAAVWMAIVYLPQEHFDSFRADKDGNFWEAMDRDPRVGPRIRAGRQLTPIKGAGDFVNFVRDPVGDGWALVGDAGQHKDPIFGQGIGDAVRSAEALADCLLEAEAASSDWGSALKRYRTKRDLDLIPNFQWMIQGKPADLTEGDFNLIMDSLGSDPDQAERFVNVFSHAVSGSEFFGRVNASRLLGRDAATLDSRRMLTSSGKEGD
ncbi:MAG TPA: NAD(P)/FAD-dependent oxidoreductase [Acidimicrobiia bacterium]|nr:NAD(P)/FAD-dependent oxidoreductase [Acidimicrobiia bacterium]